MFGDRTDKILDRNPPESWPQDAMPDPSGVLSQLMGRLEEQERLLTQTRAVILGANAHIEELEKRIARLESGGY